MTIASNASPSYEQWSAYQLAFDFFNAALFDSQLPRCILNFSRHARCYGFFAPERWHNQSQYTHEISLNPDMLDKPLIESMSTLAHEMCHLWKFEIGKEKRRSGYHCKEWAAKMLQIGLIPFNIKNPEKQTGFQVSHWIQPDGRFEIAFNLMPEEFCIPWRSKPFLSAQDNPPRLGKPPRNGAPCPTTLPTNGESSRRKIKYTCSCPCNVWGKPGLQFTCNHCRKMFVEMGAGQISPNRHYPTTLVILPGNIAPEADLQSSGLSDLH